MAATGVYIGESDGLICFGNELIELGFSPAQKGALVSILDKHAGYQFCRDRSAPAALFRLALRRKDDREIEWLESNRAADFEWRTQEGDDGVTLVLSSSSFAGRELKVVVEVSLRADSALSSWRMKVSAVGHAVVYQLTCPILSGLVKVGDPAPGESIVFPRQGEGYVFKNPYPVRDHLPLCAGAGPEAPDVGVGELHGLYPGRIPMQLCAFYNDTAGLYLATHDAGQNVKSFDVAPIRDWGPSPVFSISHFPSEAIGADVEFTYDTIIGVFHGDWCDAGDIYKAWATNQWWCKKKLWERDIPDWMRSGFGVFQMSNYHLPTLKMNHTMARITDMVNGLSKDIGVPLLALVFNWEGGGGWTGPVGFFPPREGEAEFKEAMSRLRKAGNHGFVYITGGCWYLHANYNPPFDSHEKFEAEAQPYAIVEPDGGIRGGTIASILRTARLCPYTEFTRELEVSIFLQCLDLGCTVVQIDNFPCGGSEACHDASHGHPLGHGPWWAQAWAKMLADIRHKAKAKNPNSAITTEGISENFIPYLDMYDNRGGNMEYFGHYRQGDPMGGETIPLFSYVYHQYIGAYLAAYPECNRPEVLYWTRCLGKSLVQGVVPTGGHYFPEPAELNPVTTAFYKKIVGAAARECWPYLMFGEMLRPPEIDVPTITASYCKMSDDCDHLDPKKRHEVRDRAVQHSAWRARDGSIGYFFVNVSEDAVSFDVELSAYGMEAKTYDIERFTDGTREKWYNETTLPRRVQLGMAPLSVILVRVAAQQVPSEGTEDHERT